MIQSVDERRLQFELHAFGDRDRPQKLFLAAGLPNGGAIVTNIASDRLGDIFDDLQLAEGSVVTILDPHGNVIYRRTNTDSTFDPGINRIQLIESVRNKQSAITDSISPHDGIARIHGLAKTSDGRSIISMGISSDQFYQPLWEGLYQRIAIATLIFFVSVAVALLVAISIVRPIRDLQQVTNAFADGDREIRARPADSAEIGDLARAFNRMADQINVREDKLAEADKQRSEYVSSVSHELKTPLTTIKTLTHVLGSDRLSDEEKQRYLTMITEECDREIGFVSDLLDAAVVEQGNKQKELENTDLMPILKDAINSELPSAATRDIRLDLSTENAPPEVVTDSGSVLRIIRILIENAVRYSSNGSKVKISTKSNNGLVEIAVSDRGPGIHQVDIPYVFDKFYRGRNQVKVSEDYPKNRVGLGLYIARGLAESIGGRITAENSESGGAVFSLFLPKGGGARNVISNIGRR